MAKAVSISIDMTKVYVVNELGGVDSHSLSGNGVEFSLKSGSVDVSDSNGSFGGTLAVSLSTSGQQVDVVFYEGSGNNVLSIIGVVDVNSGLNGGSWDLDNILVHAYLDGGSIKVYTKNVPS